VILIVIIILQIKDINKWPAIMLAVNRKVRAKGRIMFLKISTITIKLIKNTGVPKGIKCVVKNLKYANKLKKITESQTQ